MQVWEPVSDPTILASLQVRSFSALPLKGAVKDRSHFWSGDYWPLNRGNINYRWYNGNKSRPSPTKEEALRMTIPELATLSPAEKYDLYMGRYDYPLKAQVSTIANPRALTWEGICHGWAPAAMNHPEPEPRLLKNPDGVEVPFGSTDIKALLSYYYAYGFVTNPQQMGSRCYPETGDGCTEDLNAGAFHLVLGNRIGLQGLSFIADVEGGTQVWNNPAFGFSSTLLDERGPNRTSAPGTVKVIRVRTIFSFVDNGPNNWRPVIGTGLQVMGTRTYEYDLDLNAAGEIIGGDWRGRGRPDFLWTKPAPYRFTGLLFRLGDLL